MKTEDLKAQGLTDEQIQFVFAENSKDIQNLKNENATLKAEKSQLENDKKVLENEKSEKEKALKDLQKDSITKEEYIYSNLLSKGLDEAKVINNETTRKAFMAILDKEKIKISDDGKSLIGLKEQIDGFKKDVPHFFENSTSGYKVHDPNSNGGKGDDNNQPSMGSNFAKEANAKESKTTESKFFN